MVNILKVSPVCKCGELNNTREKTIYPNFSKIYIHRKYKKKFCLNCVLFLDSTLHVFDSFNIISPVLTDKNFEVLKLNVGKSEKNYFDRMNLIEALELSKLINNCNSVSRLEFLEICNNQELNRKYFVSYSLMGQLKRCGYKIGPGYPFEAIPKITHLNEDNDSDESSSDSESEEERGSSGE
jgi:hypothetical protein